MPTNPNRGYYIEVANDFAGLGGDAQYWRVNAEGRFYYPITDKITFVGRAIGGVIQGWGGEDVRLLDAFFKGGETIRGFDRSGYGPRDFSLAVTTTRWAARSTGRRQPKSASRSRTFLTISASAPRSSPTPARCGMLPAVRSSARGAPICDRTLWLTSSSVRSSVGGSLMWNSPVGPLRMDFAKVLTKESYDETQFFRFGAQTKF